MIDGLCIKVNEINVWISTLGHAPSRQLGQWTPPVIHMQLKNFSLNTTDARWQIVDLKKALPKPTSQTLSMPVHRLGKAESITVKIAHPSLLISPNKPTETPRSGDESGRFWRPTNFTILDHLPMTLKITQVKNNTGSNTLAIHLDLNFDALHIRMDQHELEALVRCLLGLSSASRRKDLIQARLDFLKAKKARQMQSGRQQQQRNVNFSGESSTSRTSATATSNTMTNTSTSRLSSSVGGKNTISKFISKQEQREKKQVAATSLGKDRLTPAASMSSMSSAGGIEEPQAESFDDNILLDDDIESLIDELSNDDDDDGLSDVIDDDDGVHEMVSQPETIPSKSHDEQEHDTLVQMQNQALSPRVIINLSLNEFHMSIVRTDTTNIHAHGMSKVIGSYLLEMLGAEISVIIPEDAPLDKIIQFNVPCAHFKEVHIDRRSISPDSSNGSGFGYESKWGRMRRERFEELSYIIQPKIRAYQIHQQQQQQQYNSTQSEESATGEKSGYNDFTIDDAIWPVFSPTSVPTTTLHLAHRINHGTSSAAYHHEQYRRVTTYRPNDLAKRKFFEPGKEMIRLKVHSQPESFIAEMRVNPVQLVFNIKPLIRLIEFILESMPDLEIEPPEETRIELPKYTPPSKPATPDADLIDDSNRKDFGFIVEMREPQVLIPSNYSTAGSRSQSPVTPDSSMWSECSTDDDDVIDDVSELLKISMKEVIITCDERISRHPFTNEADALYCTDKSFPSEEDADFTAIHRTMWESLPWKLKFQISSFMVELLPSLANLTTAEMKNMGNQESDGSDGSFQDRSIPSSTSYKIIDPMSLTFDLGINDPSISVFHRRLPKLVWIGHIEELHFHLNQNQCILLLELLKTYADDPPEISTLLIRNTQTFARMQSNILEQSRMKFATEEQRQRMEQYQQQIKELIPVFILMKLRRLLITLKDGGTIAADGAGSGMTLGENSHMNYNELAKFQIDSIQLLIETHPSTKQLVVKGRMNSLQLLTPPTSTDPAAVMIATHMSLHNDDLDGADGEEEETHPNSDGQNTRLSRIQRSYIFARSRTDASTMSNENTGEQQMYMIQWRFVQPLHKLLSSHLRKDRTKEEVLQEHISNSDYLKNGRIQVRLHSIHIGLNASSVFQVVQFLNSRNNVFDVSPLEVINRTVKRTYRYIRTKYLPQKFKNKITRKKPLRKLDELLSFDEDAADASLLASNDVKSSASPSLPSSPPPPSETIRLAIIAQNKDLSREKETLVKESTNGQPGESTEEVVQSPAISEEYDAEKGQEHSDIDANDVKDLLDHEEGVEEEEGEMHVQESESRVPATEIIEDADIVGDEGMDSEEIVSNDTSTSDTENAHDVASNVGNTEEKHDSGSSVDNHEPKQQQQEKRMKVHKPFFPILWDAKISSIELFLIDDGSNPNAFGVEVQDMQVQHVPASNRFDNVVAGDPDEHGIVRSYNTLEHDFNIVVQGENAIFSCVINEHHQYSHDLRKSADEHREHDTNGSNCSIVKHHELSHPMEFRFTLHSDYKRPLVQRGLSLHFMQVQPSNPGNPNVTIETIPQSSALSTALSQLINLTPEMVYVLFKLVKGQISELRKFSHLLTYIRRSYGINLTADLHKHFTVLNEHLNQGQRSVSRAMLQHESLKQSLLELLNEVEERDQALRSAINDKMSMVEKMASLQDQQRQKDMEHEMQLQQLVLQNQELVQQKLKYQQATSVTPVTRPSTNVLIEGFCLVLAHNQTAWKKTYCVLLSSETILVLTTKLSHQIITTYKTRDDVKMKYLFYELPITDRTEIFKMLAPVDNTDVPKEVIGIINDESSKLFLRPAMSNTASVNVQHLQDWMSKISAMVEDIKERNATRTVGTQTGAGGLNVIEREYPDRENEEDDRRTVDLDEMEMQYLDYLTKRKSLMSTSLAEENGEEENLEGQEGGGGGSESEQHEPLNSELNDSKDGSVSTVDKEETNVPSNDETPAPVMKKEKVLSEQQEKSLLLNEWREMEQLSVQYQIMKRSMLVCKDEQEMVQVQIGKLIEYVKQLRIQEKTRLHNISVQLRREEQQQRQFNEQMRINNSLMNEIKRRDASISELEDRLERQKKANKLIKEENVTLANTLRQHILLMENEIRKSNTEKKKLEKQLEMYHKKENQQQILLQKIKHADSSSLGGRGKSVTGLKFRQKAGNIISKIGGANKQQHLLAAALASTGESGEQIARDQADIIQNLCKQLEEREVLIEKLKHDNIRLRSTNPVSDGQPQEVLKPLPPIPPSAAHVQQSMQRRSLPPPPPPRTQNSPSSAPSSISADRQGMDHPHPTPVQSASTPSLDSFFQDDVVEHVEHHNTENDDPFV